MNSLSKASPFKAAYLIVFLIASPYAFYEAYKTFGLLAASTAFKAEFVETNMRYINGFLLVACLGFFAHLFRVYISLGIMEDDQGFHDKYIKPLKDWQKRTEFIFRVLVVIVVSLKFTPLGEVTNMYELGRWLVIVYGAMLLWDIAMWIFLKKPDWDYLPISLIGSGCGAYLKLVASDSQREAMHASGLAGVLAITGIVIVVFLLRDKNWNAYLNYLNQICGLRVSPINQR